MYVRNEGESVMAKLSSEEIIRVLEAMIGSTEAVGDTNIDCIVMENLKTVIDVGDYCLDKVLLASTSCGRSEASMHEIGWTARCVMDDWKNWLEGKLCES